MRIKNILLMSLICCSCVQKMGKVGKLSPLEYSPALGLITGQAPAHTVSQVESGIQRTRPKITMPVLENGRDQFNTFCLPCHGPSGHGNGIVVQRGFLAPPSYSIERLRTAKDSYFFEVITHGYGAMYSYSDRIAEPDRWAIIAYIRALQLRENLKLSDLSKEDLKKWEPE